MVAHRTLTPFVRVRILHPLPKTGCPLDNRFFTFIFQTVKELSSQKLRREEKCERKPSGFPFASNNPPQRQNCKIMLQNLILQFGKQLVKGVQRDSFDKLSALRFVRRALLLFYSPRSSFFFASNSSCVITPESSRSLSASAVPAPAAAGSAGAAAMPSMTGCLPRTRRLYIKLRRKRPGILLPIHTGRR